VDEVYAEIKAKERKADFADIERDALSILSVPGAAEEIKNGTDYIFVDEYQDTNICRRQSFPEFQRTTFSWWETSSSPFINSVLQNRGYFLTKASAMKRKAGEEYSFQRKLPLLARHC
jgi:hypothetical protein